jgi:hypothetical protein
MPFSNAEYRELRRHLERLLREADLATVLEEAEGQTREMAYPGEDLRAATIRYIRNVLSSIRRRSRRTYDNALEIGKEFILPETGGQISGFSLVATPSDAEFLGFHDISLAQAPDVDALEEELQQVITALESE